MGYFNVTQVIVYDYQVSFTTQYSHKSATILHKGPAGKGVMIKGSFLCVGLWALQKVHIETLLLMSLPISGHHVTS